MKKTPLWTALLASAGLSLLPACKDKSKEAPAAEMAKPAGDMGGEMAKPAGEMAKPAGDMAKPADDMSGAAASDEKKMDSGK